jgi:hypothetical protein
VQKTKTYAFARFSADVLQTAIDKYGTFGEVRDHKFLTVDNDGERWSYDSVDEFLAHYRGCPSRAELDLNPHLYSGFRVCADRARQILPGTDLLGWGWRTVVSVTAKDRSMIESLFAIFESNLADSQKVYPGVGDRVSARGRSSPKNRLAACENPSKFRPAQ